VVRLPFKVKLIFGIGLSQFRADTLNDFINYTLPAALNKLLDFGPCDGFRGRVAVDTKGRQD
jgi:hypothetical protein